MSLEKSFQKALKQLKLPDPTAIWRRVLDLALTSNPYDIDTELRVRLYLKCGMYKELITWASAMSAQVYPTPELHFRMQQLFALIRKYPLGALSGINTERVAWKAFLASEHRCKWVNRRFRAQRTCRRDRMASITYHASNWIRYVIDDAPNLPKIYECCDITPGANVGVHGNATNIARKLMSDHWTVTPTALPYALGALWAHAQIREHIFSRSINFARGDGIVCLDRVSFREAVYSWCKWIGYNKINFVPKTALTDRSIAVEPLLNSYVQIGVDGYMKIRLKRVGIDLYDQDRNARLARIGSFEECQELDPYVTIDLSSASDTIAIEVIRELLPPEWYSFLCEIRSPAFVYRGKQFSYEKFTSMGNGFCFPLETLIFASLCHATYVANNQKPDFQVYGDDIIVRQSVARRVVDVLKHYGFKTNLRKTFLEGPFRESCGKDWHNGVNVRPIFLDKPLKKIEDIMDLHNQSLRRQEPHVRDYWGAIRRYLKNLVPHNLRLCSYSDPNPLETKPWETRPSDGAFWVPMDEFMGCKYAIYKRSTWSWAYYRLVSRPSYDSAFVRSDGREPCYIGPATVGLIGALVGDQLFTLRYSAQTKLRLVDPAVVTH